MIKALPIDQRLSSAPEDVMEALLTIVSAGHPMTVRLGEKLLLFDNGFTQPDDILRFRKYLPALNSFTIRLAV